MSYPWSRIEIQRVFNEDEGEGDFELGEAPAIILEGASISKPAGVAYDITIEYASAEEGGVGTANITIPDIGSGTMARISKNAIVRVKAGYIKDIRPDGSPIFDRRAAPRYIFSGRIQSFQPSFTQGRSVWNLTATSAPETALALYTTSTAPQGEQITFKDAFELISKNAAFTVNLPDYTEELFVPEGWTPAPQFKVAFEALLAELRATVEETTGETPTIIFNYNAQNPFTIDVIDMSEAPVGQANFMTYNIFDRKRVFSAGPTTFFSATEDNELQSEIQEEAPDNLSDRLSQATAKTEQEFTLSVAFNPSIVFGLIVFAKGRDPIDKNQLSFPLKVSHIKHTLASQALGNWKTDFGGPIIPGLQEAAT